MSKYLNLLSDLSSRLSSISRVLIAVPSSLTTDKLASALALGLALKGAGKTVSIVTEGSPLVSHGNLFGVGEVKNAIPTSGGGNFLISLEGVVDSSGQMQTVPALEKLDWYPEGQNLNLVFHVIPGQRFEPTKVNYRHAESGFDMTFVIGAQNLTDLGNIYAQNSGFFTSNTINIDNQQTNSNFGQINIVDQGASSLSEIVAHLMPDLNLNIDQDTATNIVTGIYSETANLTQKVTGDTFLAVGAAMQKGAQINSGQPVSSVATPVQPIVQLQPVPQVQPIQQAPVTTPVQDFSQPATQPQIQTQQFTPQSQFTSQPQIGTQAQPFVPAEPVQPISPFLTPDPNIQFNFAPTFNQPQSEPVTQPQPIPTVSEPQPASIPTAASILSSIPASDAQGSDLRQIFQIPNMPSHAAPVHTAQNGFSSRSHEVQPTEPQPKPQAKVESSPEELPVREYAGSTSPEMDSPAPDWLVPKIFKGGNLG